MWEQKPLPLFCPESLGGGRTIAGTCPAHAGGGVGKEFPVDVRSCVACWTPRGPVQQVVGAGFCSSGVGVGCSPRLDRAVCA